MGVPLYSAEVNGLTDELSLVGVDRLVRLSSGAKPIVLALWKAAAGQAARQLKHSKTNEGRSATWLMLCQIKAQIAALIVDSEEALMGTPASERGRIAEVVDADFEHLHRYFLNEPIAHDVAHSSVVPITPAIIPTVESQRRALSARIARQGSPQEFAAESPPRH